MPDSVRDEPPEEDTFIHVHPPYMYIPHTRAAPGPQRDEPPEEGTVHKATVRRIEPYGVFVQLDGFRKQGLVHSSQVRRGGGRGGGGR